MKDTVFGGAYKVAIYYYDKDNLTPWTIKLSGDSSVTQTGNINNNSYGIYTYAPLRVTGSGKLTDNGLWDAMSVTVDAGPRKVSIQGKSKALKVGETCDLIAKLTPANAVTGLTWTSSKPDVASVDQNGKVTAHTPGKTQITVLTSNNKTATKWITVATH